MYKVVSSCKCKYYLSPNVNIKLTVESNHCQATLNAVIFFKLIVGSIFFKSGNILDFKVIITSNLKKGISTRL